MAIVARGSSMNVMSVRVIRWADCLDDTLTRSLPPSRNDCLVSLCQLLISSVPRTSERRASRDRAAPEDRALENAL